MLVAPRCGMNLESQIRIAALLASWVLRPTKLVAGCLGCEPYTHNQGMPAEVGDTRLRIKTSCSG